MARWAEELPRNDGWKSANGSGGKVHLQAFRSSLGDVRAPETERKDIIGVPPVSQNDS
jgi:hypothetical protein